MTYSNLKLIINDAYSVFCYNYIIRKRLGANDKYSLRTIFFVKCIYKSLMNQIGDIDEDLLTKEEIQDMIKLFNKYSNSSVVIEYI